jgi:hypothetical protein
MLDSNAMRARFAELVKQRDAIHAKTDPLQAQRAKIRSEATKAEADLADKIKAAQSGLAEINDEIAMISRALKGKTAVPVTAEAEG